MKPVLLHIVHLMCVLSPGLKEGKALAIVPLERPPHHAAVGKSFIMNNLDVGAQASKGGAYDASGKGRTAVVVTTAAEAHWSQRNERLKGESKPEYHARRTKALHPSYQASAQERRSVTLNPEEGRKSGSGKGRAKKGRSKGSGGGRR